ncbi:MAG TPA: hypothetical protein VFI22_13580 [Thermomicrobiales bacterium]|nr:hypothetical protein [Thermomicrobiales bacterium]
MLLGCADGRGKGVPPARRAVVVAFWIAFSATIIIVGRLVRHVWTRYRWTTRRRGKP